MSQVDVNQNQNVNPEELEMSQPDLEAIVNAAGLLQLIPIYGRSLTGKDELVFANVDSIRKSLSAYDQRLKAAFTPAVGTSEDINPVLASLFSILACQKPAAEGNSPCSQDAEDNELETDTVSSVENEINNMDDVEAVFSAIERQEKSNFFSPNSFDGLIGSTSDLLSSAEAYMRLNQQLEESKAETSFKCKKCDKSFGARRNLYFHERQVHDVQKAICPDCGRPVRNHATLIRHRRTHYGKLELKFICTTCGKRCRERRHLVIHCSNLGHPVPPDATADEDPFINSEADMQMFEDMQKAAEDRAENYSLST